MCTSKALSRIRHSLSLFMINLSHLDDLSDFEISSDLKIYFLVLSLINSITMLERTQSFGGPHQLYLFFHEIYIVARSYQFLMVDIKSLIICAVLTLETLLKIAILAILDPSLAQGSYVITPVRSFVRLSLRLSLCL